MPDILVCIQARLGSSRLPGKVLLPIGDRPCLAHIIDRVRLTGFRHILTIPEGPTDDRLYNWAMDYGVPVHRGPHPDVLLAMANAAASAGGADVLVRITGDCPFVQPDEIRRYVGLLERLPAYRYVSNAHPRRLVFKGGDVEVFDWDFLQEAVASTLTSYDREHVTPWMRRRMGLDTSTDDGEFQCVLDTPEDYAVLQTLAKRLDTVAPHPTVVELRAYFTPRPSR